MARLQFLVITQDANNTYRAKATGVIPDHLINKQATCTSGRTQAIEALLAKATPPLKLVRIIREADICDPVTGKRSSLTQHLIETEES